MKKKLHSFSANYQSIFIFCFALLLNVGVINSQTEISINGGFETGDFTGWTQFASGTQNIITTNPSEGTYYAELNNNVLGSASIIKNANIGIGTVSAVQEVTITFDARGSTAVGGVAFAEFFSELSGGGVSSSEILGGGPLNLNADPNVWTSFSFTTTTGSDVSGGLTLQLTATTGGATGSIAHMFYDNVSVTVGTAPPTCTDGIENGDEEGVDCGGSCPNPCPTTCTDGIENGDEEGVDCGGSCPNPCPSQTEIAVNGGFETGDFTGWTQFASGTQNIITTNPSEGTYCAELNNTVLGSASIIKNANIGVGLVNPGDQITITFDARGSTAVGGVAFAEFFSELSGGGVSSSEILGGGPLALNADPNVWTSFSFTTNAGSDVSGGVTLQLTATTGGAAGSIADLFYDNVSIIDDDVLSIDENNLNISLDLYPNPSNNVWNVRTNNIIIDAVSVFDVLGKQVLLLSPNASETKIDGSRFKSWIIFCTNKNSIWDLWHKTGQTIVVSRLN